MKKTIMVLVTLVFLYSCEKENEITIDSDLVTGDWRLNNVTFNEINGEDLNNWVSNSTILNFENDQTYYRNYVTGKWNKNENGITLYPNEGLGIEDSNYEIIELTAETLKLKILLTEEQYCCDFEKFKDEDVITIIEEYTRSE